MLYGTDLSSAYQGSSMMDAPRTRHAGGGNDDADSKPHAPAVSSPFPPPLPPAGARMPSAAQASASSMQQAPSSPMPLSFQQAMELYAQQKAQASSQPVADPSYWELWSSKRREVMKLFLYALVILLGLSLHHLLKFFVKRVLKHYGWAGTGREIGVRVAYPLLIFLFLWHARAVIL